MKKLKPLLPSLKEKKRYLAFEIVSKSVNFDAFSKAFWQRAMQFVGEVGSARAGFWLIRDVFKDNRGIIKVNHKHVDDLRGVLCTMDKVDNTPVIVRSTGVSGILKKAALKG